MDIHSFPDRADLEERGARLREETARLAGAIVETEDAVARAHEAMAQGPPSLAAGAADEARRAREFADHERREQRRWALDAPDIDRRSQRTRPGGVTSDSRGRLATGVPGRLRVEHL